MKLQVGSDDFGKVIINNLNFVDKTLFIKEIIDNNNIEVSVITRPRRFGKTFNLSTLHYFLASEVNHQKTEKLFDGLKIAAVDNGFYMQYQGKYPVIFISFKSVKGATFQDTLKNLQLIIQELYSTHRHILNSDKLEQDEKDLFRKFLLGETDKTILAGSLKILTGLLYKHTGKKVYLLIDEYDTPIQSGYSNNYYDEIVNLMRDMFGSALKTNPYLDRAVVTGILRIAKESIFSDLNNIKVYSVLHPAYGQHFGFTEEEVTDLLVQANISNEEPYVKAWYNGYVFGGTTLYNPWSIVNYINDKVFKPYWVNTSDNQLIRDIIVKSSNEFKEQFELLLQEKAIEKAIDESMVFGDLKNNSQAAWSLLLMSGYLKADSVRMDNNKRKLFCLCSIPNWEVKVLYCDIIETWLGNGQGIEWYQNFLTYLLNGNIEKFTENFGQILSQTISVHDVAHNPEAFYHGFMLGLIAGVDQNQYALESNRESGLGRYDVAIIPRDTRKPGIILEIKSVIPAKTKKASTKNLDELLAKEAQKALKQINNNQYMVNLVHRGISNIIKIGLAFSGKNFSVASETTGSISH